jgi:hypothetical protein
MELVRLLNRPPQEIGILRHKDPAGISFLERKIIWEYKEREKHEKEMARKAKQKKGGKHH